MRSKRHGSVGSHSLENTSAHASEPFRVDPAQTGPLTKISPSQGAISLTRDNASDVVTHVWKDVHPKSQDAIARLEEHRRTHVTAHQKPTKINGSLFVGLIAIVAIVIGGLFWMGRSALDSVASVSTVSCQKNAAALADQQIVYGGYVYGLRQNSDGTWVLVQRVDATPAETRDFAATAVENKADAGPETQKSEVMTLGSFVGTPVGFVLYQGTFYIGENKSDNTWDVICMPLGEGAVSSQLVDDNNAPVAKSGSLKSIKLRDNVLSLVDASGKTLSIPL